MAIEFNCPACGQQLRVGDEHAGKIARCPQCQAETPVPEKPAGRLQPAADQLAGFDLFPSASAAKSRPNAKGSDQDNPFASPSGNPYATPNRSSLQKYPKESRGQTIVILAFLSYATCFSCGPVGIVLAILAWGMAQQDLTDIQLGLVDPNSEGSVRLGRIMSIVYLLLWGVVLAFIIGVFALSIAVEVAK